MMFEAIISSVINISFHSHFCVCVEIILSMLREAAVPDISPPLTAPPPPHPPGYRLISL